MSASSKQNATKRKSPSPLSAAKKAAKERREMVQVGPKKIHASLLTKEQALENLSILSMEQMKAFAKAQGVGSNCPEEFRQGLGATSRMRKNITLFLTGKECKYIHHLILSIYHLYPTSTGASHHFLLIQISQNGQTNLLT